MSVASSSHSVVVGGGTRFLPDGLHIKIDLLAERRFGNGTIYLRVRTGA